MSEFSTCLEHFANKDKRIYEEFYEKGKSMIQSTNPWLIQELFEQLQQTITTNPIKGQKEYAYKLLYKLISQHSVQITPFLSILIPMTASDVNSSIKEVKDISLKTLKKLLNSSGN